jgi:hypothetical protein
MSEQDFHITIPKPCHENWDKMTPHEKGRFCSVCSKTVRDFSHSSKEEIIWEVGRSPESICGRVPVTHISQIIQYRRNSISGIKLLGSVLAFLGLNGVFLQKSIAQNIIISDSSVSHSTDTIKMDTVKILGTVRDLKTKKPLDYVGIIAEINGVVKAQVISDDNGNFSFALPSFYKEVTVKVFSVGYTNIIVRGIPLDSSQTKTIEINMEGNQNISLGGALIIHGKIPMISPDGANVKTFDNEQLRRIGF